MRKLSYFVFSCLAKSKIDDNINRLVKKESSSMDINFIFKGHSVIVKGINDRANGNRGIVFPADTKEATNSQGAAE